MPEWKSFTFGEDGEATPTPEQPAQTAPANPAMEPDEYAAKWGTEVSELTIERIVTVLEGDGLECGSNEFIVATQLNGVPLQIPSENGDNWILVAASRFFVGEGLSDRQIHAMARRGLIIGLQAAEELPTLFDESEDSEQ